MKELFLLIMILSIPLFADNSYLLLMVDAPHFDYSETKRLLRTIAKHPIDGSKNGDFGHAWILLKGVVNGRSVVIEGGHSGECGLLQPRYFDGIVDYMEMGDPNPVKYLFETQKDGFFQKGSGGHVPTCAIKITLTEKQFAAILEYINPCHYDYKNYSISANQCVNFVTNVALIAGLKLQANVTIPIQKYLKIGKRRCLLWTDCAYSKLTIASPDALEKSMRDAVRVGKAEEALKFYLTYRRKNRFKMLKSDYRLQSP